MNIDPDLFADLDDTSPDVGCSAGFEILHRFVEAGLAGDDPAREFPGLAMHLRRCPACRSDYEGLVEAAEQFGDIDPR
ncbi:MAG: hypothetical protein ABI706_11385 [Ilumatobacteraceae bacterium]